MSSNVSSKITLSLTASSTGGPSLTSIQKTLRVLRNVTSSPAAVSGPSPREWPDGQTTRRCGREAARASRSPSPVKDLARTIQGTFGPTSFDSSAPVGPLSLWASRLQERLATVGSTELPLTWKEKTTPAERLIFRLAPSMRRTSALDFIGSPWATPRASDGEKGGPNMKFGAGGRPLPAQAATTWPTPRVASERTGWESTDRRDSMSGMGLAQCAEAVLGMIPREVMKCSVETQKRLGFSTWPTPTSRDWKDGGPQPNVPINSLSGRMVWPTPTVADVQGGRKHRSGARSGELLLNGLAATWPTPTSLAPAKNGNNAAGNSCGLVKIREHALVASGPITNGEPARTEKPGALNPEFVFWLMGFPDAWASSALRAMQSLPRSPRKSSPPSSKHKDSSAQTPTNKPQGSTPQETRQMAKANKVKHVFTVSFTTIDDARKPRELQSALRDAIAKAAGVEKAVVKSVKDDDK